MPLRPGRLVRKMLMQVFKGTSVYGIPVLCYHSIDPSGSDLSTSLPEFRSQMRFLKENGYETMSLTQLHAAGTTPMERRVVITFDDGFANNFDLAFPVLKQHSFTATFFITAKYAGTMPGWLQGKEGFRETSAYPIMSWDQIKELRQAGMEIGSHTISHPYLSKLPESEQEEEIRGSKEIIERHLKEKIAHFCYPYGDFDQRTVTLVRGAGYTTACTTAWGINKTTPDPFQIKRVLVAEKISDEFPFYFCRGMDFFDSVREAVFGARP